LSEYDSLDVVQGMKCMHCRFLHDNVIPSIHSSNDTNYTINALGRKVLIGLESCSLNLVCLKAKTNTKKFSVYDRSKKEASFVPISLKVHTKKFIVSCLNDYCRSSKGSKKNIENFDTSEELCDHLHVVRSSKFWQELKVVDEKVDLEENSGNFDGAVDIDLDILSPPVSEVEYFDEATGLRSFPCRSLHKPHKEFSEELSSCIRERDTWNERNLIRNSDGCLLDPELVVLIPDTHSECGSDWVDSNKPDGMKRLDRKVTIHTEIAPVVCSVFTRYCLSDLCDRKLKWDEGESICVHVYSTVTAAGDEIGWEFVNQVLRSKVTFSSFV